MHTSNHHHSTHYGVAGRQAFGTLLHMQTVEQPDTDQWPQRRARLHGKALQLPQQLGWQTNNTESEMHASRHCAGSLLWLRLRPTIKNTQQVTSRA